MHNYLGNHNLASPDGLPSVILLPDALFLK